MVLSEATELKVGARLKVKGGALHAIVTATGILSHDRKPHIATNYGLLEMSLCEVVKLPRIYLAGPMTGLPENNYPEFNRMAKDLRRQGFQVENPAENDLPESASWADYMRVAIGQLIRCDVVVQLEGWEKSEGAKFETDIALRLKILTVPYGTQAFTDWYNRVMEA